MAEREKLLLECVELDLRSRSRSRSFEILGKAFFSGEDGGVPCDEVPALLLGVASCFFFEDFEKREGSTIGPEQRYTGTLLGIVFVV